MTRFESLFDAIGAYFGGKIDNTELREAVVQGGPYAENDIADLVELFATAQRPETTEDIVRSNQFLLGRACERYNIHNLAKRIDEIYAENISKQEEKHRGKLLANEIYVNFIEWEIKEEHAALVAAQNIAEKYLARQQKLKRYGFNYDAGKEFATREIKKKDMEKIETELRQKISRFHMAVPKTDRELDVLMGKAEMLESKGKINEAGDIFYVCQLYNTSGFAYSQKLNFFEFCKRNHKKDERILDLMDKTLQKINEMGDSGEIAHAMLLFYEERANAYEFLGNNEAAEKDRKAREEMLDKI